MTPTLLLHDRLASPTNHDAYLEVLDTRPHKGYIKVFDTSRREDKYIELERLLHELHTGSLTLLRNGKPRVSLAMQADDGVLREKNASIGKLLQQIGTLRKKCGISLFKAYGFMAEEHQRMATPQTPPLPPISTVYRYHSSVMAGLPALRGNKNKGNRTSRYSQDVIDLICDLARKHYLIPESKFTLDDLTDAVNQMVSGSLLPEGHRPISKKYVIGTIKRFVTADPSHARMHPNDAVAGTAVAGTRIRVAVPFERVEQDVVHLPFVLKTPTGISSEVQLAHAIDCCTSVPLGWKLIVGAPTDADTLACIEMYMSPIKSEHFKRLGIKSGLNLCGTPGQLVVDNGQEVMGPRIQKLEALGVDVKHCRAHAGHEKPFIERLNLSLKRKLQTLPGSTRFNGKDGERDPVALGDELMTLEELEVWIVRWFYELWAHQNLERLKWDVILDSSVEGETPAKRWRFCEDTCYPISLPPPRNEWLAALYEHTECKLNAKSGIAVKGLRYKGRKLNELIARHGNGCSMRVIYDPDDFRYVYVCEGDDLPLVTLTHEHLRPETPAWSMREAKNRLEELGSASNRSPEAERFEQDLLNRSLGDASSGKRRKPSKRERNRQTAQLAKHERAVLKAVEKPGPQPPLLFAQNPDPDTDNLDDTAPCQLEDDTTLLQVRARNDGRLL